MSMEIQTVMGGIGISILIVIAATVEARAQDGGTGMVTDDLSIGERVWPPVSNGIIFIDGKYLPPPYIVSRREGCVFVNEQGFDYLLQWPPIKTPPPPPPPETEPVMPESITEKTTKYDKEFATYISNTRSYLMAKHGQEKGIEMMVDVYRKLPCVKAAQREKEDSHSIKVIWMDGEKSSITQVRPRRKDDNYTKEQAERIIDKLTGNVVHGLGSGDYYMMQSGVRIGTGTMVGAKKVFLPIADAMHATENEEDFLAVMKTNQPPGGISEKTLRSFYKHKDEMPAWEARIRALEYKR